MGCHSFSAAAKSPRLYASSPVLKSAAQAASTKRQTSGSFLTTLSKGAGDGPECESARLWHDRLRNASDTTRHFGGGALRRRCVPVGSGGSTPPALSARPRGHSVYHFLRGDSGCGPILWDGSGHRRPTRRRSVGFLRRRAGQLGAADPVPTGKF